jgi:hypothetical protein
LITWTVVTSFLFVISAIFAIYFYVDASKNAEQLDTVRGKYKNVIAEGALQNPEVTALANLKDYDAGAGYFYVALERGNRMAKLIAGASAQTPEAAMAAGNSAIASAADKVKGVGLSLSANNLVTAVNLLADQVVQRSTEAANNKKTADEAVATATQLRKDADEQIAKLTQSLTERAQEVQDAKANVETMTQAKDQQLQSTADATDARLKETQDALNRANLQVEDLKSQLEAKNKELVQVQDRLRDIRPNVNTPVLQQADGRVVRLPGGGICFIDLGSGDQVIAGMTFEVYDRNEGIPPPGDPTTDLSLPKGKASLEVTRVGPTSSECRIVRTTPGSAITEGDLVANLVYDRNVKNKFLVYGSFDLDRDGKPTAQDAEVIKRLVTQWGGQVVNDVNVDTDFVVLGAEPAIPSLTREEREDPIQKAIYDKAVADAEAYANISARARDYRIPILNQNRFLYMVGYYELSRR